MCVGLILEAKPMNKCLLFDITFWKLLGLMFDFVRELLACEIKLKRESFEMRGGERKGYFHINPSSRTHLSPNAFWKRLLVIWATLRGRYSNERGYFTADQPPDYVQDKWGYTRGDD